MDCCLSPEISRIDSTKDPFESREARLGNAKVKLLTLLSKLEDSAAQNPSTPWAAATSSFSSRSANCEGLTSAPESPDVCFCVAVWSLSDRKLLLAPLLVSPLEECPGSVNVLLLRYWIKPLLVDVPGGGGVEFFIIG